MPDFVWQCQWCPCSFAESLAAAISLKSLHKAPKTLGMRRWVAVGIPSRNVHHLCMCVVLAGRWNWTNFDPYWSSHFTVGSWPVLVCWQSWFELWLQLFCCPRSSEIGSRWVQAFPTLFFWLNLLQTCIAQPLTVCGRAWRLHRSPRLEQMITQFTLS